MTDDKHWQNIGVQVAHTNNHKRGIWFSTNKKKNQTLHMRPGTKTRVSTKGIILDFFSIITQNLLMTDGEHWQNMGEFKLHIYQ